MANQKLYAIKEVKVLQANSYRYHRMMTKLGRAGSHDDMDYENACREIGRLQGFEQGVNATCELCKNR